jgi:hypothetical protein
MGRQGKMNRSGMTLILVTAIGVIAGILAMSMIDLGRHARTLSVRNVEGMSARAAADAGLADGAFWMQQKLIRERGHWQETGFPRTMSATLPGTGASYTYTISVVDPRKQYQIDSTGFSGGRSRTVHGIIHVGSQWKGVGVITDFTANVDVQFLGAPEIRTNAATASEGQITFKAAVVVSGDVVIGPGGDVDSVLNTKGSTVITGDILPAEERLEFSPVLAPTPAQNMPAITTSTTVNTSGTYQYPTITLPNGGQLLISAPNVRMYVTGNMRLNNGSQVVIQSGASLELYLGGNLEDKNSVGFSNETNDPGALKIYGLPTCTQIDLKTKSEMYAALYAPSANVDLYNNGTFYGAVCCHSFEIKNSGVFCYDDRVRAVLIDDMAAVFETERWWED